MSKTLNGLVSLAKAFSLEIHQVYYGGFTGHWRRALPLNRFVYIFQGGTKESRISDPRQTFVMKPGYWLFIPAGHEVEHEQYDGLELISIHFTLTFYSNPGIISFCRDMYQGYAPEKMPEFRSLVFGKRTGFLEVMRQQKLLCEFLLPVVEKEQEHLEEHLKEQLMFRPLFDTFRQEPKRNLSIDDMARIMKMGKESFIKQFTGKMAVSPKEFFNRIRATAAAQELIVSNATIREIAEEFGFTNEFYFSRFIKRHLGMSPREWRNTFHIAD